MCRASRSLVGRQEITLRVDQHAEPACHSPARHRCPAPLQFSTGLRSHSPRAARAWTLPDNPALVNVSQSICPRNSVHLSVEMLQTHRPCQPSPQLVKISRDSTRLKRTGRVQAYHQALCSLEHILVGDIHLLQGTWTINAASTHQPSTAQASQLPSIAPPELQRYAPIRLLRMLSTVFRVSSEMPRMRASSLDQRRRYSFSLFSICCLGTYSTLSGVEGSFAQRSSRQLAKLTYRSIRYSSDSCWFPPSLLRSEAASRSHSARDWVSSWKKVFQP